MGWEVGTRGLSGPRTNFYVLCSSCSSAVECQLGCYPVPAINGMKEQPVDGNVP